MANTSRVTRANVCDRVYQHGSSADSYRATDGNRAVEHPKRFAAQLMHQRVKSEGRNFPSKSLFSISSRLFPVRSGMRKYTKIHAATLNNA